MNCFHESLHDAKAVIDDLGQGSQAGGSGGIANILRMLYFLRFLPITNMGTLTEGAEMMTLLAPPFKCAQHSPW